ncbi:arsenate reductase ArsC [Falsirhodobacter xinxiangensis]|uniref:arsenate reductase ArsC n=1 Tax=Falsirhodobacter xinxiangensis TaxID=2530049 RepID=UPI0010AA4A06|nr:arsenate reductase ArsC [Rhodobacter xinxiangensis]
MSEPIYNVLFLCTGNSARSIIAESVLSKDGEGRFPAFSAGSNPKGDVHPIALKLLNNYHYPTDGLRSKSLDEFAGPDAPKRDFIFTVCGNAAGEVCPFWPGQPISANRGITDPAAAQGTELNREMAFIEALRYVKTRIGLFKELPVAGLNAASLTSHLHEIGRLEGSTGAKPEAV